ncbi:PucR family transcriptional regulator [Leucobacter denitrificans]|uniref:Helix-turn-helix domain-containing protein n=1 Tax=Leucobacter denitrificans TaxID=683042 RepID=A0A7G9S2B1_9MICO|nr:helix-turn-helix domain-containing protein [Leucobacter denitrificans]QNN61986.1 helix-turn-helix domain-containing protein [Leucobacter denitrificans]
MDSVTRAVRLSELFHLWDAPVRFAAQPDIADPSVTGALIWEAGAASQSDLLVLVPQTDSGSFIKEMTGLAKGDQAGTYLLIGWGDADIARIEDVQTRSTIAIAPEDISTTVAIESVIRSTIDPTAAELRRLTALQRSFTQELSSESPTQAILERLKRLSNAVSLVVTTRGTVQENTGQIPLQQVLEQLGRTDSPSQFISVGDWHGQAVRLQEVDMVGSQAGWLVVACRREGFPDSSASAAIHIAASLIETVRHINAQARSQEEAVRTSLLEQTLALRPQYNSPELESRVAAIGLSFDNPLRVIVASPHGGRPANRAPVKDVHEELNKIFSESDIVSLSTARDDGAIFLVQASEATIQRLIRSNKQTLAKVHFGLGRNMRHVGDAADSLADAWLGIRTLRAGGHSESHISFEQFDFATRLFSNVGIDVMAEWSRDYLEPLLERDQLISGLRQYFLHSQNIASAADALGIHHNSLRYRLAKVEELLDINLRDPAAISSLYLAITSLDLAVLSGNTHALAQTTEIVGTRDLAPANSARFPGDQEGSRRPGARMSPAGMPAYRTSQPH